MRDVVDEGAPKADDVDPVVLVEALVLGGHHRLSQQGRDLTRRQDRRVLADGQHLHATRQIAARGGHHPEGDHADGEGGYRDEHSYGDPAPDGPQAGSRGLGECRPIVPRGARWLQRRHFGCLREIATLRFPLPSPMPGDPGSRCTPLLGSACGRKGSRALAHGLCEARSALVRPKTSCSWGDRPFGTGRAASRASYRYPGRTYWQSPEDPRVRRPLVALLALLLAGCGASNPTPRRSRLAGSARPSPLSPPQQRWPA